jgi:hypothetical protein
MTLGAFADRLKDERSVRDKLIAETVDKLYRMPTHLQEKEHPVGWWQIRAVRNTLKTAVEFACEVKTSESPGNDGQKRHKD